MKVLGYTMLIGTLVVLAACAGTTYDRKAADEAHEGAPAAGTDLLERAVTIARAIEADPDQAQAILEQNGLTIEQFEKMMYDISLDPELAAAYQKAIR